jgi:hypothetical protein
MAKGQMGGDFSQGYNQTIDQEFLGIVSPQSEEMGTTQDDFESQAWPKSNQIHPNIPNDTRVRPRLGMSPDLDTNPTTVFLTKEVDDKFTLNFPDIEPLRQQWEQNKAINITPVLPDLQANIVRDWYMNQPNDWWDRIIYPDPDFDYDKSAIENPGYYHMYNAKAGDPSIERRLQHAYDINNNGGFSYTYRRTGDPTGDYLHPYLKIFQSDVFKNYLSKITGYDNLGYSDAHTFVSNYGPGDFNGPHTDGDNGRIAFVYHLSKDWRPQYGGLFMRMDWDWQTVNKVIVPPFNTLSIFDTQWQGQQGAPHLVSEVAQGCNNRRISYTGWYL